METVEPGCVYIKSFASSAWSNSIFMAPLMAKEVIYDQASKVDADAIFITKEDGFLNVYIEADAYKCPRDGVVPILNSRLRDDLDKSEWIIDEYSDYTVVWSMYLYHSSKDKNDIFKLNNNDIVDGEKWTKKLTLENEKFFCVFKRTTNPVFLEALNSYQVMANLECEIGEIKLSTNTVVCNISKKNRIEESSNSNEIIKSNGHSFGLGYSCNIYRKHF